MKRLAIALLFLGIALPAIAWTRSADQRIAPPKLEHSPHIIAIPSNPLSPAVKPLNIDGEWLRLPALPVESA